MRQKPTISANVIIYNEERVIKRCLDSLKGIVDEIVIVHDGPCTDRTLEIAKTYTKKIYIRPRFSYSEAHRSFALEKSTGSWILAVDADEVVSPKLRKNLRKLVINADKDHVNGYELYWPFYEKGVRVTNGPIFCYSHKLNLFRKSKAKISGVCHDWYKVTGTIKKTELELDHPQIYNSYSYRNWFKKNLPRIRADALYRVNYGHAKRNFLFYLFKAPLWFVLYFMYFFSLKKFFIHRELGMRLSLQFAIYNFLLYYSVFEIKLNETFKNIRLFPSLK